MCPSKVGAAPLLGRPTGPQWTRPCINRWTSGLCLAWDDSITIPATKGRTVHARPVPGVTVAGPTLRFSPGVGPRSCPCP